MPKFIAITIGDIKGIGIEILLKTWRERKIKNGSGGGGCGDANPADPISLRMGGGVFGRLRDLPPGRPRKIF